MRRSDWFWGIVLALGFGLLYVATAQERFYSDGAGLVEFFARGTGESYYHVLYLPLCRALGALLGSDDPLLVPRALSQVSGAVAVGSTFLLCRSCGIDRDRALFAAMLLGVTPAVWFFSTTVEVHAVHLAAVAVGALVVMLAPWRWVPVALGLSALTVPLLYGSHITAVLLMPGWIALVVHARGRQHCMCSRRGLVVVAVVLGLAALLSVAGANAMRGLGFTLDTSQVRGQISDFYRPPRAWWMILDGWLWPTLLLMPLALVSLSRRSTPLTERIALAALIVPSTLFFLVWGVAEKGAYFLGTAPFMALAAARSVPREMMADRGPAFAAAVLILVQGAAGWHHRASFDQGFEMSARAEAVEQAIGAQGLLISTGDWAIDISIQLPGVREERWVDVLAEAAMAGHSPEQIAPAVRALAPAVEAGPVAVDLSHRVFRGPQRVEFFQPYYKAIEAELERTFATRVIEHESWPMMVLKPAE